jgi:general secretion pathway protein B
MSYILDALRKADAQRERDPARGIHAQPVTPEGQGPGRGANRRVLWIAVAGVLLVAGAALTLFKPKPSAPAAPDAQGQRSSVPAVASPVMPPLGPANQVQPPPPPALPAPAPAPTARVVPPSKAAAAVARPAVPASVAAAPLAPASTPAPAVVAAPAPGGRILNPNEVPDLPKLAISGGVFSENPAQRMLIVSGQVVKEGAELVPGVTLEQIRAKSAVVHFRGLRVAIPY